MMRFLRDQGLAIVMFGIFAVTLVGLVFAGWDSFNRDRAMVGEAEVTLTAYVASPDFGEAIFENWESEFLQMGAYVLLTAFLFSRGSAESRDPDHPGPQVEDLGPAGKRRKVPWPVRRGGLALTIYEHSLTIALFAFFLVSFVLHAVMGAGAYSRELVQEGGRAIGTLDYLGTSRFWFESLQNWQSEFLSVGALIVLSIFLRERRSPESKPVAATDAQTGA
ncbi:MAG: hypothetical protein H0W81_07580 [Chloroflexi bacterium]|nr:hypothetical protein [Chloroflexota bacterium]